MKPYLAAALLLIGALAIYALDRGVYIGSKSAVAEGILRKNCRYLFVTGVAEVPAHGGVADQIPAGRFAPGFQLAGGPDRLYCRFFGE